MNVYFDCEFTGLHQRTTLISIGCVSDDGCEFYAELDDFDLSQVDEWIKKNVTDCLWIQNPEIVPRDNVTYVVGNRDTVAKELAFWLARWDAVEMWSDVYAYDWMLFCELFGGAFGVQRGVNYIPFDLATLFKVRGIDPDIEREKFAFGEVYAEMLAQKHNALWDAGVIRECYHKVML